MNTETHEISFSFDQPDEVLRSILTVLQQLINQHKAKGSKMPDYRNVLIIDNDKERAPYLAHILAKVGYRPLVMESALDAFTRFLRVPFVPFIIILSHDDSANRLFLQRLMQQIMQKYSWEIPLIRLLTRTGKDITDIPSVSNFSSQMLNTPPVAQQPSNSPSLPDTRSLSPHTSYAQLPPTPGFSSPSAPALNPHPRPQKFPGADALPPSSPTRAALSSAFTSQPSLQMPGSAEAFAKEEEPEEEKKIALEGQSLGRYQILNPLGDSPLSKSYKQYGHVYKTYDRLRERPVALKVVPTSSLPYHVIEKSIEETNPFQLEVDLLRGMEHQHILPLWNSGKSYISGTPFIYKTMPYCTEGSLGQWLYEHGGSRIFSPREVLHILLQLADALQHVHDRQIIYQNFKHSNLLVHNQAKDMQHLHLLLVDFAIPQDGTFLSRKPDALPYIAPERWHGQVFPASDQYGLAVMAYELLTGRHPFQGSTVHVMKLLHTNLQPQPPSAFNSAVSSALSTVVLRALAKKPEDRFSSITIFAQAFQKYCS